MPVSAVVGFVGSMMAVMTAMSAGLGTRLGWWDFRNGFEILRWAAYLGIAGTAVSIAGAIIARPGSRHKGFLLAVAGIVLGSASCGVPGYWLRVAKEVPMIHDISTDTENPPKFVSILPLRKDAPNPAEYGGPEVAAKQHAAYPDIRTLRVPLSPPKTYDVAMAAAGRMKWRIVDGNPAEGRIEAVATTRWFGFKDDVVIRIAPSADGGSLLDVRSVSRVGKSDIGTNARRIREFLKTFADAAKTAA